MAEQAIGLKQGANTPPARPVRKASRGGEFNCAAHGLRGIASMMVFWGHILGGTAKHIYAGDRSYVDATVNLWHFGTFGVELFFVISGFVILPSILRYAPGDFALRRFFRIYPLFFAASLFFIVLNAVTNAYAHLNDPVAIIAGLLFLNLFTGTEQLTPNAWSLTFEVLFYTLTCLTVLFLVRRPSRIGTGVMILASLAFVYAFPIAIFFLFGLGIRLLQDRNLTLPPVFARPLEVIAAICCAGFASMAWFAYTRADLANPIAIGIIVSTACYFYLAVSPGSLTGRLLGNPEMGYLGTVSYSLYLVHPYTYFACRGLFSHFGLFEAHWAIAIPLLFLVTTPLTLLVTHAVHHLIELRPYEWFFHQRIYRTGQPSKAPDSGNAAEAELVGQPTR